MAKTMNSINGAYSTNKLLTFVLLLLIGLVTYVFFNSGYYKEVTNKFTVSYQTDYNDKEVELTVIPTNELKLGEQPRYIIPFEVNNNSERFTSNTKYEMVYTLIEDSKVGIMVKPKDMKYFKNGKVKVYQKDGLMTLAK